MRNEFFALALALNGMFGLPIAALWDPLATDVPDGHRGLVHFYVRLPDGSGLDAMGVRSETEIAKDFGFELEDLEVETWEARDVGRFAATSQEEIERARRFVRESFAGAEVLERLLAARDRIVAKLRKVVWGSAPRPEEIRQLDQEPTEDDLTWARALLAQRTPEQLAAALARIYRARLPSPEDILDPGQGGGPPRSPRSRIGSTAKCRRRSARRTSSAAGDFVARSRPPAPNRAAAGA